ncbi:MAG: magnesium transporter CorA [Bacteroidetes bacterium B1(2017)]|nr:MAG: magnesium transporter CorA [Bacteroidetes bacterium B1(2017)]
MLSNYTQKGFPFEWKDVFNPAEDQLMELAEQYKLPSDAVIDCMQAEHLPKYEVFDNYYFLIIRFFDLNCKPESDNIRQLTRKVAIFYNKDFILTIHRSQTEFIEKIAEKYSNDRSVKHPFDIACKIIKNSLETFSMPISKMDTEIDVYESSIFLKKRVPDLLKNLYLIKRKTSVFKKLNSITRMALEPMPNSHKRNSFYEDMRDYHLRLETETEELHDNINNLLNLYISLSSQKTNEVMRILTVFSAFFLPLTFIVGVYGMNFEFMPELHAHWGYPGALIFMTLVTILIFQWFKRKKWL